jgi:hypothetical protein
MTWLLAGLFAGIVSGAVTWLISLIYKSLYVEALVNEVTTFAAFTALLVFLASVAGVSLGRWLVDRNLEKQPRQHHGLAEAAADQDRADTDVFAAVSQPASAEDTETVRTETLPTEARREEKS